MATEQTNRFAEETGEQKDQPNFVSKEEWEEHAKKEGMDTYEYLSSMYAVMFLDSMEAAGIWGLTEEKMLEADEFLKKRTGHGLAFHHSPDGRPMFDMFKISQILAIQFFDAMIKRIAETTEDKYFYKVKGCDDVKASDIVCVWRLYLFGQMMREGMQALYNRIGVNQAKLAAKFPKAAKCPWAKPEDATWRRPETSPSEGDPKEAPQA